METEKCPKAADSPLMRMGNGVIVVGDSTCMCGGAWG